jgi:hypothetical protein
MYKCDWWCSVQTWKHCKSLKSILIYDGGRVAERGFAIRHICGGFYVGQEECGGF